MPGVRQGRRQDDAVGRTAYGGERPGDPTVTSKVLIGLNAAVWLLILATGGASSPWVQRLAIRPEGGLVQYRGQVLQLDGVSSGAYWQLLTSVFTHVEVWHIGFNMLALYVLGPQLEVAVGRIRFLVLYLLSGLAGSALVMWAAAPFGLTLGASGAIFGLMGGLLVIAVKVKADLRQIGGWIAINFVVTVLFRNGISWQGHLGGFLGGVTIAAALVYAPRQRRTWWQGAGVGAVALVIAASILARIAVLG